jgi:YVTN family beta-propeller protein
MKNKTFKKIRVIFSALFFIVLISACNKHSMDDMNHNSNHMMLNINYPAAYVVNGMSNNISVIKLDDLAVSATINLNGASFPHHIYINPSKTKLAVAITSTDLSGSHVGHNVSSFGLKIQIIDVVTGNIDKEISLEKMPHNAIFNKNGNELWIGQMDTTQSQILVYETSDWELQKIIKVGKGLSEITFSEDGRLAFACNTIEGTVAIIDPISKQLKKTISVGKGPVGAWSASNGKMYVDNEVSQTISEISLADTNITATINLGFKPGYVSFNKKQNELWVSDATNGKVAYYSLIGEVWTLTGKIVTGTDAHAIAFNSEGTKAFVTNQGAGTVTVLDVDSHTVQKTIKVGEKPNGIVLRQ